ncbi:MAG TPA: flagellar hook-length control protein FliK [Alphaproteobacteria bacterium]|nr:flagellar hook-length control protein FliK [Alphaproteobacteria bacterium]
MSAPKLARHLQVMGRTNMFGEKQTMDVSALKSPEPDALPAKGKKAKGVASTVVTIANLAQSFTEMVKAGFSIDRGAGAITDRFSFTDKNPTDRSLPRRRDDVPNNASGRYDYRRDDPGRDYLRADANRNDGMERSQNGNINAANRDNSASGPATVAFRDDTPGKGGNQSAANSANTANTTNSGGESEKGPKQAAGENSGGNTTDASTKNAAGTGKVKTAGSNSAAVKSSSEKLLAGQIALTLNSSGSGQASKQSGDKTLETDGRENAAKGLAKALAGTSKRNRSNAGAGDQAGLKNHGENGPANAKTNADAQAATQAATDPAAKARDVKARQAAGIAKTVGDDNKLAVQVSVLNEADVLVSKPRSSLLGAAAKSSGDNKSAAGRNGNHNGAQNPAQSGLAQAQNQAATQAQSGIAQATQTQTASGLSVKAQAQGAFNANTGVQTAGGTSGIGGENLPGAGAQTTTQADHGRQAGEAKSAAGRAGPPPRAVIQQVTVQITKALSAGIDKITIQLRPETLGRVEVQLEMAKDGKAAAVVIADNKDTLDLLKQDSQNLQQALQDAGLDLDSGDLSFNLRGEEAGGKESDGGTGIHGMAESGDKSDEKVGDVPYADIYNDIIEEDRIDVRA